MKYSLITIPARSGKATHIKKGQSIKIINTHGKQVIDTWAFNESDLSEYMSMEHSRASFLKLMPQVGDIFCTNKRNPIRKANRLMSHYSLSPCSQVSRTVHSPICPATTFIGGR